MAVTVYRSDDAGAPTLTVEEGDLITLLDAVLINGYGAKAAAGWTKPFSGTNQAVYRNSTASGGMGCFFQVDDSKALSGSSLKSQAKIRGASNCTGFDALTEEFGTTYNFLNKGYQSDANAAYVQPWIIVADEHTCILFSCRVPLTNSIDITAVMEFTPQMFGDFNGWAAGQVGTSLIAAVSSSSQNLGPLNYNNSISAHKDELGVYPFSNKALHREGDQTARYSPHTSRYPQKNNGKHVTQKLWIDGVQSGGFAGTLRGFQDVVTEDSSDLSSGDTFTQDGKTFLLLRTYSTTHDLFAAVETSDTWEPM